MLFALLNPKDVPPNPKIYLYNPAYATDAAAVNSNGIKTFLANALSTFFIIFKPVFSDGLSGLPRNPPNCTMLGSSVLDNFILANIS